MDPLILNRTLKLIEEIYDESMYGQDDLFRIKDLVHSVDQKQWDSKQWLVDEFAKQYGEYSDGSLYIIGGWYGLLANLLREKFPQESMNIKSIDMDSMAEYYGHKLFYDKNISFDTYDITEKDETEKHNSIICTSCEHIDREDLLDLISKKKEKDWVVLQSNNYFEHVSHINCSESLYDFVEYVKPHLKMQWIAYAGELDLGDFKRFMIIGK